MDQWGDDVAAFCDALGIEKPVVVGSSFGGFVAMSYAGRHPDHPSKLVLDSTSARLVIDRMFPVFERLGGAGAVDAAKRFWSDPSPENLADYSQRCLPLYSRRSDAMQKMGEMVGRAVMNQEVLEHFITTVQPGYDQVGLLSKITCPTLVLSGDDDPVTPTACSKEIVEGLDPTIVRFEQYAGGHGMFGELPEQADALLREFVES
jgi:proline iminopeptidase